MRIERRSEVRFQDVLIVLNVLPSKKAVPMSNWNVNSPTLNTQVELVWRVPIIAANMDTKSGHLKYGMALAG